VSDMHKREDVEAVLRSSHSTAQSLGRDEETAKARFQQCLEKDDEENRRQRRNRRAWARRDITNTSSSITTMGGRHAGTTSRLKGQFLMVWDRLMWLSKGDRAIACEISVTPIPSTKSGTFRKPGGGF